MLSGRVIAIIDCYISMLSASPPRNPEARRRWPSSACRQHREALAHPLLNLLEAGWFDPRQPEGVTRIEPIHQKPEIFGCAAVDATRTSRVKRRGSPAVTGGTLDPLTIPKYVTPLVIPPVMNNAGATANDYDIAVRQFKQQILPGGIWATLPGCTGQNCAFPATTVWSYGPPRKTVPTLRPGRAQCEQPVQLPGLHHRESRPTSRPQWTGSTIWWTRRPVTSGRTYCRSTAPSTGPTLSSCPVSSRARRTRPRTAPPIQLNRGWRRTATPLLQVPYDGPVPIITHVHGAHVGAGE